MSARVGFVSLGCPKALVDSERILTQLRASGYEIVGSYDGADVIVVNTCGFIDSAVQESLDAIGEALTENGKVIVTGCLGAKADIIRQHFPEVLHVSGPQQYESVVTAVQTALPLPAYPFSQLLPPQGIKLTPRHYAYIKIAEGCNHHCRFCIIPSMRGKLNSRPIHHVLQEAEKLVKANVKELLIISQDTSAYGLDLKYAEFPWKNQPLATRLTTLANALGDFGVWVRLHYVYPYPHVDEIIPLMASGRVLPYLDIPLQHGSPRVLKLMRRPAATENTLARIKSWRAICPELTLRSTFIVGFPGETEDDFQELLAFIAEAQLDRVGCFQYSPVEGAAANALPDPVPDDIKEDRYHRFMQSQAVISAQRLQRKIGQTMQVLIDTVTPEGTAIARSSADAPEIDGVVHVAASKNLRVGDWSTVRITDADEYDLWAEVAH